MAATSQDPLVRLEELLSLEADVAPRRMLVIVNPYASTVSERLAQLIVHALRGRYQVRAVGTEARGHATELCRAAASEGYDAVVAFGGDGTVNEAANGLIGSETALFPLPGGRANVYCRMLGIPAEIVDATEHLLGRADAWHPRRVDVGRVNGRHFLFSSGLGLDASVVQRVDAHPRLKARGGEWYYAAAAVATFTSGYLVNPPRLLATLGAQRVAGVTAIVQCSDPYTYFGDRPVRMGEGATLESGDLAGVVLQRSSPLDVATVSWRVLSRHARLARHRRVHAFSVVRELTVTATGERALPLQVDGDHIGEVREAAYACVPGGLLVLS